MKLTVGKDGHTRGFALPTILLVSTVMMIVLVASVSSAAASRSSLDSQYYSSLAKQAAESGIARAKECLGASGYIPQWSTASVNRNLRPDSSCTGATATGSGVSQYVIGDGVGVDNFIKTKYSIDAPASAGPGSILKSVGTTELLRTSAPYAVWRTYSETLYYRIEPPQVKPCQSGFIGVPGNAAFGTSDFCIAKYETKNVGGQAVSQASGTPLVDITQSEAIAAASSACSGCHLITEGEWMTVAHNVLNVASNWSGGSVGSGYIYSGHNDGSPANALAASTSDSDGYYGTGNSSGNQRRTLTLSNGEVIWDLAGNVWDWTSGQTSGGQPGGSGFTWREWNAVGGTGSLSPNPFPSYGTPAASSWTGSNGIGRLYSNSDDTAARGFRRGGYWSNGSYAGVFSMALNSSPDYTDNYIGFRLAR